MAVTNEQLKKLFASEEYQAMLGGAIAGAGRQEAKFLEALGDHEGAAEARRRWELRYPDLSWDGS